MAKITHQIFKFQRCFPQSGTGCELPSVGCTLPENFGISVGIVRFSGCVQCALASPTVPKGRSGRAKTNFFLQYLSISATILLFFFFKFCNQVSIFVSVFYTWRQRVACKNSCRFQSPSLSSYTQVTKKLRTFENHITRQLFLTSCYHT